MPLLDPEPATPEGDRSGKSPRAWSPRDAIGVAVLGILLALVGAARLLSLWLLGPPPQPCRLPLAPVPETPGQLAWAPGSSRFLAACEGGIYLVDLPERGIQKLPLPPAPVHFTWFDAQNRPLALTNASVKGAQVLPASAHVSTSEYRPGPGTNLYDTHHLLRWESAASRWRKLSVSGNFVTVSADGCYAAAVQIEGKIDFASPSRVTITDLRDDKQVTRFRFPQVPGLSWYDSHTLIWFVDGTAAREPIIYRIGDPAPKPLPARHESPSLGASAGSQLSPVGATEVLARLREWKVPGIPRGDAEDLVMTVFPENSLNGQEYPLGRSLPGGPFRGNRPQPQISPNGRYVAAVAGDGTLRLLDLKPPSPQQ